mgnify:CR=1 FL=1
MRGTLQPINPSLCVTNQFHSGEQAALDVAQEIGASLLINEQKAHQYAVSLGLDAVSVPEYLVILMKEGILTVTQTVQAYRRLDRLNRAPRIFMEWARQQIRAQGGHV